MYAISFYFFILSIIDIDYDPLPTHCCIVTLSATGEWKFKPKKKTEKLKSVLLNIKLFKYLSHKELFRHLF